ncbi:MAG TPA: hydantoinase B/oxoprolinase family protein [Paracoccus sp. (in: a-proteobacteria)]|uniref:hydantoinase B/oxoprolinase family protein n=1 Tax=Paracoccus sp. TaxID=267 RepID=UPI002D11571C|nr:hydantoinase B/oxoprolinase family protein [Paracoccus sp. (in: a-proteobacteria)]HWL55459.1 hydantoinase B/oxoprolinase family protein [Paracoccus sp. (in: a-proteobacteria)]
MAHRPPIPTLDPLLLAVVRGALQEIASEMDAAFYSTAFSPIISEGRDIASGLFHPLTGEVIAQGEESLPLFVTIMQQTVQHVLRHVGEPGKFQPGDIYIVNDPYYGGTHLPDVKMVMPVFLDGDLLCFLANTGHWPDVGGAAPGSFPGRATEIYQEGLMITPIRLYRAGELDADVLQLILRNIRVPEPRRGDILGQVSALNVGAARMVALSERYSRETLDAVIAEIFLRSESAMRSYIRELPDGVYHHVDYMDSDGINETPLKIALRMTVRGDTLTLDFTGSAPPCKGPFNAALGTTVSACHVALKHLFLDVPINAGAFAPVEIIVPGDCFLNARHPKPVSGATAEVSQRLIDTVMGAFAQVLPEQVTAGCFSSTVNVTIGGDDPLKGPYVMYLYFGGGYGAHAQGDGISNGCSLHSTARMTPAEIYEQDFPFRVRHFRLREGSAGRGRYRGGFGVDLELELLRGEALLSMIGDRGVLPPAGRFGGEDAQGTALRIKRRDGTQYSPPYVTKDERVPLSAGDIVQVLSPGGAGYGPPAERDPALRRQDERRGYFPG